MPFPAARLTDKTVTNDTIIAPGAPTVLIGMLPASVLGDAVGATVVIGVVVMGSPTVLTMGRPQTRITSNVVGVCAKIPVIPMTTIVGKGLPTVLVP